MTGEARPGRVADLTVALSLATDLGTGQPMEHGLRTCWLSLAVARALGLSEAERSCVYYVALLRFVGCTSDASEIAARVEQDWVYRPGQFEAVSAATVLLSGSESVPVVKGATARAAAAIPGAEIVVLEGHAHFAHKTDPTLIADVIGRFLSARSAHGRPGTPAPSRD